MEHHPTPKSTVDYMRKHKQGMFSAADKKLVKENTPSKSKALASKIGEKKEEHRTKKERYENTLRIGKGADDHFKSM